MNSADFIVDDGRSLLSSTPLRPATTEACADSPSAASAWLRSGRRVGSPAAFGFPAHTQHILTTSSTSASGYREAAGHLSFRPPVPRVSDLCRHSRECFHVAECFAVASLHNADQYLGDQMLRRINCIMLKLLYNVQGLCSSLQLDQIED